MKSTPILRPPAAKPSSILLAFTLIELLVVIAIIAILASAFARPRAGQGQGARIRCVANLKQIGLAFQFYRRRQRGFFSHDRWFQWRGWLARRAELQRRRVRHPPNQSPAERLCRPGQSRAHHQFPVPAFPLSGRQRRTILRHPKQPSLKSTATATGRCGPATVGASNGTDRGSALRSATPRQWRVRNRSRLTAVAKSPANKIISGDHNWHGNRPAENPRNMWHNFKGQRRNNVLFGDGHVQYFRFPRRFRVIRTMRTTMWVRSLVCRQRTGPIQALSIGRDRFGNDHQKRVCHFRPSRFSSHRLAWRGDPGIGRMTNDLNI